MKSVMGRGCVVCWHLFERREAWSEPAAAPAAADSGGRAGVQQLGCVGQAAAADAKQSFAWTC
eukprot:1161739-Pelagomonas_calceolata.AAC.8